MSSPQRWEVVGGVDKGGILVRSTVGLSSESLPSRLSTGAVIEELERVNERLHYRLLRGTGPRDGWITIELKGKTLARPVAVDETGPNVDDSQGDRAQVEGKVRKSDFDPYKILGVKPDATDAIIKSAYRKASLKVHPDRNPSPEAATEFRQLTNAKDFLLNPMKRLMYNVRHGLNQRTYEQWWSDWDQIFDEMDPDEDLDRDAEVPRLPPQLVANNGASMDILIFGATGIAGALACKMLHGQLLPRTWAIVGRDERKLRMVAEKFGGGPLFRGFTPLSTFADAEHLVKKARVVVDFSGPKWKVGSDLAEVCARSGVHYIDNSLFPGDVLHASRVREKLDAQAKASGACLVHFCGYAVQADLGVWFLAKHFREKCGRGTRRVDSYEHSEGFTLSGTSMLSFVGPPEFEAEVEKRGGTYLLGGLPPCGMREEDNDENPTDVLSDELSGMHRVFLPMQDRAVVRCSSGLFEASESYGPNFLYKNWTLAPDARFAQGIAMGNFFLRKRYEKAVAEKKIPPIGTGPKERVRRECMNTKIFVGEADVSEGEVTGAQAHCIMRLGPGNVGEPYECTTMVALEAAQCILSVLDKGSEEKHILRPGFGTPISHLAHLGFCEKLMSLRGWQMSEIQQGLPSRELFENVSKKTLQIEF